uniref:Csf5 n=1 Tax=Aromatoleum aromaticum (strain DSM 19018 / LMG 30748 / EbN1) TaxID=76114 RepID=UPI000E6AE353|nr:Chain A, Csf5 [Aromatoleum aromaticum EbN1]6H9H_B Chain B, Csf5 [Aromatoleum aromaticum EbN1]6H9I_A Chain A, Csf5 [Aromatoleum aromaticum EbN1]6H9I_B Chain B, Csf5 [Aromatoleum aromaticum EbN1]
MGQQHLLRFALPAGKKLWPNDLREALAKHDLPPLFFSRDPQTGHAITRAMRNEKRVRGYIEQHGHEPPPPTEEQRANPLAIPGIRIVGSSTWVGILATGERYKPLLEAATLPAIQIVTQRCGRGVGVELEQHTLSIKGLDDPKRYFVRNLVMKRGLTKTAENTTQVASRILSALERQAVAYSLDLPPTAQVDIHVESVVRPRGMRLVTSTGATEQFVGLADVEFYACLDLKGYWFAGNLTSRGYGRIIADHPAMSTGRYAHHHHHH